MKETQVRFVGWEDPLEKEMATHSSILAWRIPWTEEPDRLQSMGSQESDTPWGLNHHMNISSAKCFLSEFSKSQVCSDLLCDLL